ncbi:MAG: hypothetical protein ACRYGK_11530 [Janthinobacterium lividum]
MLLFFSIRWTLQRWRGRNQGKRKAPQADAGQVADSTPADAPGAMHYQPLDAAQRETVLQQMTAWLDRSDGKTWSGRQV